MQGIGRNATLYWEMPEGKAEFEKPKAEFRARLGEPPTYYYFLKPKKASSALLPSACQILMTS